MTDLHTSYLANPGIKPAIFRIVVQCNTRWVAGPLPCDCNPILWPLTFQITVTWAATAYLRWSRIFVARSMALPRWRHWTSSVIWSRRSPSRRSSALRKLRTCVSMPTTSLPYRATLSSHCPTSGSCTLTFCFRNKIKCWYQMVYLLINHDLQLCDPCGIKNVHLSVIFFYTSQSYNDNVKTILIKHNLT